MTHRGLTRRKLLELAALLPAGAIIAACGGSDGAGQDTAVGSDLEVATRAPDAAPTSAATALPTATLEPFILPAREDQSSLMPGTRYETPIHLFGTGTEGPILLALGGVHGNEPGGWMAAERLLQDVRPRVGGLLVVPRANRLAIDLFQRTTDELGDLNRLYPGDRNGPPMAQMAYEIVETIRRYHVSHVIDMHESWAFYRDRTDTATGTAYLGQTMSTRGEPGEALARTLVSNINDTRIQGPQEEFTFREWPPRGGIPTPTPGADGTPSSSSSPSLPGGGPGGSSRSSLGLPNHVPGVTAILVEMGQQQDLERRVQLHVDIVQEALRLLNA